MGIKAAISARKRLERNLTQNILLSPLSKAEWNEALELLQFPWYSVTDDNPIYLHIRLRIRTSQYYICISLLFFVFLLRFHYIMPNIQ